jgi:preprotein translocase subunit SecB
MKLEIAQAILEQAQFGHVGRFLEREATGRPEKHRINLELNMLEVEESNQAVVRLTVRSLEGAEYTFSASYLMLLGVTPEEGDPTGDDLKRALTSTAGMMLMPMLREAIANLTMRGRFGALWLPPIDFFSQLKQPDTAVPTPTPPKRRRSRKAKPTA